MSDFKSDRNTLIFQEAVKLLELRFPGTTIAKKLNYSKGNVSAFLNGKKPVPTEFLENFLKTFNVNLDEVHDRLSELKSENTQMAAEERAEYKMFELNLLLQEKDLRIADKDKIIEFQAKEIERLKNEIEAIKSRSSFSKEVNK